MPNCSLCCQETAHIYQYYAATGATKKNGALAYHGFEVKEAPVCARCLYHKDLHTWPKFFVISAAMAICALYYRFFMQNEPSLIMTIIFTLLSAVALITLGLTAAFLILRALNKPNAEKGALLAIAACEGSRFRDQVKIYFTPAEYLVIKAEKNHKNQ